jgi:hypothetical protein
MLFRNELSSLAEVSLYTGSFPGVKYGRGVLLTTHPPSSAAVTEQYSYTSTHPLGHTGPVTESLYILTYTCIINVRLIIKIGFVSTTQTQHF